MAGPMNPRCARRNAGERRRVMEPESSRPGPQRLVHRIKRPVAGVRKAASPSEIAVMIEAPGWHAAVPRVARLARRAAQAALAEAGRSGMVTVVLADDRAL